MMEGMEHVTKLQGWKVWVISEQCESRMLM